MDSLTQEERVRKTESKPRQTYEACCAAQGGCVCMVENLGRKKRSEKERDSSQQRPVTAVKEASLNSSSRQCSE